MGACRRHLDAALTACASATRLLHKKDARYPEEEKRHLQWLGDVIDLKVRLFQAFAKNKELYRELTSLAFLDELPRLDRVPVDLNADWLAAAARRYGAPDMFAGLLTQLRDHVLVPMIQDVVTGADVEGAARREAFYHKLVGPWLEQKAIWEKSQAFGDKPYGDFLDAPSPFYPPEMREGLNAERPGGQIVAAWREWVGRYPRSTGPARHLAMVLIRLEAFGEARKELERAIAEGFYPAGRTACEDLLRSLGLRDALQRAQAGDAAAASDLVEFLEGDEGGTATATQAMHGFVALAQASGKDPGHEQLSAAVASWLKRARLRLKKGQEVPEGDGLDGLNEKALAALEADLDECLLTIFLAPTGLNGESPNWEAVQTAASNALTAYPRIQSAYFYRMLAWWSLAVAASERKDDAAKRSCGRRAREDAQQVVKMSKQTKHVEQATQILEATKGI